MKHSFLNENMEYAFLSNSHSPKNIKSLKLMLSILSFLQFDCNFYNPIQQFKNNLFIQYETYIAYTISVGVTTKFNLDQILKIQ